MTYRVTTYLDVRDELREIVQGLLIGSLGARCPQLESQVRVAEGGVEVDLKIDAEDDGSAARKAVYWLERAAKGQKALRWTGKTTKNAKVVAWT